MYQQPTQSFHFRPTQATPPFRPMPSPQFPNQQVPSQSQTPQSQASDLQFYASTPNTSAYSQGQPGGGAGGTGYGIPSPYSGKIGSGVVGASFRNMNAQGAAASSGTTTPPRGPIQVDYAAAFGTGGFEGEPPLLQELGINFQHIKNKSIAVLNPLKQLDQTTIADADLAGPLVFYFAFGMFLLTSGKVHFSYIYGVALLGCLSLYTILNLMSYNVTVDAYKVTSVLGYCLLPIVGLSFTSNFLGMVSLPGFLISSLAILWATISATKMFVVLLNMHDQRWLIAYPIAMFYSVFALMTVFKDRKVA